MYSSTAVAMRERRERMSYAFEVEPTDSIDDIKQKIQDMEGFRDPSSESEAENAHFLDLLQKCEKKEAAESNKDSRILVKGATELLAAAAARRTEMEKWEAGKTAGIGRWQANEMEQIAKWTANKKAEMERWAADWVAEQKAQWEVEKKANKKAEVEKWQAEQRVEWEAEKQAMSKVQHFEPIVKLDVGGVRYTTSQASLNRFPDTMIGCMFSGRHTLPQGEDGHFFIDRDGTHFRHILNFLRSPGGYKVSLEMGGADERELRSECEYYGIDQLMFYPCTQKELSFYDSIDKERGKKKKTGGPKPDYEVLCRHQRHSQRYKVNAPFAPIRANAGWPRGRAVALRVMGEGEGEGEGEG
ncbi:hypothetical protein B484DRAFT_479726 [Ochromonadaceae sp. CCMP2298]|nr:hypothetical protein B484DRAFT_479726 [Ochromonadaceae sp. CCMP2298]